MLWSLFITSTCLFCFCFSCLVLVFFFGLASLFAINGTWVMQRNSAAFIWGEKKNRSLDFRKSLQSKALTGTLVGGRGVSLGWRSAHCFCWGRALGGGTQARAAISSQLGGYKLMSDARICSFFLRMNLCFFPAICTEKRMSNLVSTF